MLNRIIKSVIVTGASRGIGKAIAEKFVKLNSTDNLSTSYQLIATATSNQGLESIKHYLDHYSSIDSLYPHMAMALDISKTESIEAFYENLAELNIHPAILVNNAGITSDNLLLRMKDEEWSKVITTNLTGTFAMSRYAIKSMVKNRWGRIINISSIVASSGNAGQTNYAASKAGIEGFTRALALEVASRNLTVNNVAPGFITTDMTNELSQEQKNNLLQHIPMRRFGQAEDIAEAVVFLASDAASYVTGTTLSVNGGMYMS